MGLRNINRFQQIATELKVSDHLSSADQCLLESYGKKMRQQGKLN